MKKSGICPKCGSQNILTNKGVSKRGERSSMAVSSFTSLFIEVYMCTDCGFFEEYIDEADLRNPKKLEKLNAEFKKPKK
ncbi:MAG: hypothetical protein K1X56_09265 [Flavobacteriales bacterium]|nr:hypothetical protein [Flavobacteriales bacterium]